MIAERAWARLRAPGSGAMGGLLVMAALFYLVPTLSDREVTAFSVYSAFQVFATYGLIALALGLTMIAAQFDLSTLGMFALGGMLMAKTGQDSVLLGAVVVVAAGALAGLVQGTVIARLGIDSMSVTLGGYLVLLGATRALGSGQTVGYENVGAGVSLDNQILEVFSWHSIVVLAAFALLGLVMTYTRLGRDIRAVGGDARASHVAGVRVNRVLVGVFMTSGALAGLAGALNTLALAAALPNPGFAPLIFAATAALIGGVGLAGGRGSAVGIAAGALALSLLQAMFGILASPQWVTSVVTGGLLAVAAVAAAPGVLDLAAAGRARLRSRRGGGDHALTVREDCPITPNRPLRGA